MMTWEYSVVGFLTGVLVGLTGIGGGIIMTPILLYLGVTPTVAVGSDLVYGAVTKWIGTWRHARSARVRWEWVIWAAVSALPAAWAGSAVTHSFHLGGDGAQTVLRHVLGAVLVLASISLAVAEWFRHTTSAFRGIEGSSMPFTVRARLVAIGGLIGFLVGLTSIGSGSLFAVAVLLLSRMGSHEVVGTDLAFGALLVSSAALAHAVMGTVDYRLVGHLLVGSAPGVLLGSRLVGMAPPRTLRVGLACCILASGLRLAV